MADVTVNGNFVFFWRGWPGQWFRSPFYDADGILYSCAEKYMMAKKALFFGDQATYRKIMAADKPKEQKDLGREVANYDDGKWKKVRELYVYKGTVLKFRAHPDLKEKLLATDMKILVEASPVDKIWGIGLEASDPRATKPEEWKGLNLLGKALMRGRYHFRTGEDGSEVSVGLHD